MFDPNPNNPPSNKKPPCKLKFLHNGRSNARSRSNSSLCGADHALCEAPIAAGYSSIPREKRHAYCKGALLHEPTIALLAPNFTPKNKKIVLSRYATFDETSLLKPTVSQQVERKTINVVSQWVEVDATPPSPVCSALVGFSPNVTRGGNRVAVLDVEQVDLFASIRTKLNSRQWVKKRKY